MPRRSCTARSGSGGRHRSFCPRRFCASPYSSADATARAGCVVSRRVRRHWYFRTSGTLAWRSTASWTGSGGRRRAFLSCAMTGAAAGLGRCAPPATATEAQRTPRATPPPPRRSPFFARTSLAGPLVPILTQKRSAGPLRSRRGTPSAILKARVSHFRPTEARRRRSWRTGPRTAASPCPGSRHPWRSSGPVGAR